MGLTPFFGRFGHSPITSISTLNFGPGQADNYLGAGVDDPDACDMLEAFLDVCTREGITLSPKKFEWGGYNNPV